MSRQWTTVWLCVLLSVAFLSPGHAQEHAYPKGPITIVVPYGAGGNGDLAARALAFAIRNFKALKGQPVIIVNKAGAGGLAGSEAVLNAKNDGYTLLLARVGSQAVQPALDPKTSYKWDSFSFIGLLQTDPYVCVVKKDSPYTTFGQLLEVIKSAPGKLSFATTGNMDASVAFPVSAFLHVGLKPDAAVKIPYKGTAETVSALLGGHVDFSCNGLGPYLGSIESGDLRALIASTSQRIKELANVPTVGELGMKHLEAVSGWSALYGPANLPEEVIRTWAAVLQELGADEAWRSKVLGLGSVPRILSPDATREFAEAQHDFYLSLSPYMGVGK